jgi:hypothetical protein
MEVKSLLPLKTNKARYVAGFVGLFGSEMLLAFRFS